MHYRSLFLTLVGLMIIPLNTWGFQVKESVRYQDYSQTAATETKQAITIQLNTKNELNTAPNQHLYAADFDSWADSRLGMLGFESWAGSKMGMMGAI